MSEQVPSVEVLEFFRGRITNEQIIAPGVYRLDDPRLFGAGEYLLDLGKARLTLTTDDIPKPPEPVEEQATNEQQHKRPRAGNKEATKE